jgi:hypothetical protein
MISAVNSFVTVSFICRSYMKPLNVYYILYSIGISLFPLIGIPRELQLQIFTCTCIYFIYFLQSNGEIGCGNLQG